MEEGSLSFGARAMRRASRRPLLSSAIVFSVGAALFLFIFLGLRGLESARRASDFETVATARVQAVKHDLDADTRLLDSVAAFYRSEFLASYQTDGGSLGGFAPQLRTFLQDLAAQEADLKVLAFVMKVTGEERAGFEGKASREVLPAYEILDQTDGGPTVTASRRAEYYAVYTAEPFAANIALVGLDMMAKPELRDAMEKARDTGTTVPTRRLPFTDAAADRAGAWVYKAVYQQNEVLDNQEVRRRRLIGFVAGGIHLDRLVDDSFGSLPPEGIDVYLYDGETAAGDRLLYVHASRTRGTGVPAEGTVEIPAKAGLRLSYTFQAGGHPWTLLALPAPKFFETHRERLSWSILAVGILLTVLLLRSAYQFLVRDRRIEQAVIERTEELRREIGEREQVEGRLKETDHVLVERVRDLDRRSTEIDLLNQMGGTLQRCLFLPEAYPVIARFCSQLLPEVTGSLYLCDEKARFVERVSFWGPDSESGPVFPVEDCWALRSGKPHIGRVSSGDPVCAHVTRSLAKPSCTLCVPLMAQSQVIGLLSLRCAGSGCDKPESCFDAQLPLILTVADQISLSLANIKLRESLREQSIRDTLTGLYNRRYMEESIRQAFHRSERTKTPVGVIMMDIDHFKRLNDEFGHETGDEVLRALGAFLLGQLRESDTACRYGGEEFLIIMPEANLETTRERAEHIRENAKSLVIASTAGRITLSLGVAVFPDKGADRDSVLAAADAALYKAKHEGRDRVVVA